MCNVIIAFIIIWSTVGISLLWHKHYLKKIKENDEKAYYSLGDFVFYTALIIGCIMAIIWYIGNLLESFNLM